MDRLTGVSSNIMMGQNIHAGTNNCDILLDEDKFLELVSKKDTVTAEVDIDMNEANLILDEIDIEGCDIDDFKMSIE